MKPVSNTKMIMGWLLLCLSAYGAYCFWVDAALPMITYIMSTMRQLSREELIWAAILVLVAVAIYVGRK